MKKTDYEIIVKLEPAYTNKVQTRVRLKIVKPPRTLREKLNHWFSSFLYIG